VTTPSYSPLQQSIFDEIASGSSSLLIEGVAGCGKSFTIEHSLNFIPEASSKLIVFTAFNKRIADELETRLPRYVQCATFHKRALAALTRVLPKRPKIDGDKTYSILKDSLKWSDMELYSKFVMRLIGFAKNSGLGLLTEDTEAEWWNLISHNALSLDSLDASTELAVSIARKTFRQSNEDLSKIDFDDMLYLAIAKNASFDKASYLFVDEAQDTNTIQRELLRRMLRPTGRLIAVGDKMQAIYGFRGADASAMDLLQSEFNMKPMPLSVCYRCSKAVVAEAQKRIAIAQNL